jgi:hypothetical protein
VGRKVCIYALMGLMLCGNAFAAQRSDVYIATDRFQSPSSVANDSACLAVDTDQWYYDVNCNGVKDVGENYLVTDVSTLVPYSGATTDVDLGSQNLTTTGTGTFGALTVESNTVDFGDVTDGYVLTFDTATNTWAGEAAAGGAFDSTTVDATTWSDGANASNVWTFDVSGTDHTMTAGNGLMTFSHDVSVGGSLKQADNIAHKFGSADDATILFDGNSLNITANAVTATDDLILTADQIELTGETIVTKNARITAAPASDHTTSGITIQLVANEAQAIGDAVYINADGEAQLGDADAIASSKIIALCADASIAADATGNYLLHGIIRDDTWAWTVGGYVYLSTTGTTGNTLTQTAPSGENDVVITLGVATHADRMLFTPGRAEVEHTG